jgi:hypothetical protein
VVLRGLADLRDLLGVRPAREGPVVRADQEVGRVFLEIDRSFASSAARCSRSRRMPAGITG